MKTKEAMNITTLYYYRPACNTCNGTGTILQTPMADPSPSFTLPVLCLAQVRSGGMIISRKIRHIPTNLSKLDSSLG